ncbi:hypothetical protein Xmau_04532 [Xenorhabdus mauleonii]|uniref:DUF4225 domain-containing protein n=1 Tax=Xenorhabdus mauleonii TaxID=351675 RepID=A0A1I3YUK1_9GAMM|nr:DUF4225 domain-containing protein [Xenorhabdus mauleonii]PHM33425.1 hypothetical protein Xmau_04532 [Xenorhabdus mauleonii]SFK34886.1 Protein of unknown function [Xenorhabdus mauleonii]
MFINRNNNYYSSMGALTARSVMESALTSSKFLDSFLVKQRFQNEVKKFTDHKLDIISSKSSSESSKLQAIQDLKQEKSYLTNQENIIRHEKAKKYAYIEIKKENDAYTYVLKGIGLISSAVQFITGVALVTATTPTAVGYVAGSFLIVQGAGSFEENLTSLLNNDAEYKGYLRRGYEDTFEFFGSDKRTANLVYGGVDIALSGYGVFRNVLKPEAWRLFYYIKDDYVASYKTMGGYALTLEISADVVTLKSIYDAYNDTDIKK